MAAKKQQSKKKQTAATGPLVALWGLDKTTPASAALSEIAKDQGVRVRALSAEQLNNPVGYVAGMIGYRPALQPYVGEAPSTPFMLFCGFTSKQMDAFLQAMRDAGVSVPCKAILTKINKDWPFIQLMQEVSAEHAAVTGTPATLITEDSDGEEEAL